MLSRRRPTFWLTIVLAVSGIAVVVASMSSYRLLDTRTFAASWIFLPFVAFLATKYGSRALLATVLAVLPFWVFFIWQFEQDGGEDTFFIFAVVGMCLHTLWVLLFSGLGRLARRGPPGTR